MSQTVIFEATPNPQTMKFIVTDRVIASETVQFKNAEDSRRSPLARKLFGFPWAAGVLVGPNFITVTKQEWVDWQVLAEPLANLIEEHITSKEVVLLPPLEQTPGSSTAKSAAPVSHSSLQDDSAVVQQIKAILDNEIRPAVAQDGGDVSFYKFEDGRLYLEMHGSCQGCPSATMTLKEGIEVRMRERIPEIVEVLSIS